MHIDTAGTYTLQYTATDSCGNETIEERTVEVVALHTTLFTDGTFIINEKPSDRAANIALHGAVTNEYDAFNPNGSTNVEKYIFASASQRPWHGQKANIISVEIGSPISPTSTAYWFHEFTNCTSMDLGSLDTSNVGNMRYMFYSCRGLTSIDVTHFDTSSATNMNYIFGDCRGLTTIDVTHFDTSNVTDMGYMFRDCRGLTSIDVTHFDTSSATNMTSMFNNCQVLPSVDVTHFDTSNVRDMSYMFNNCYALPSVDVTHFDTSRVTNMNFMFYGCRAFTVLDIANFNTSNVTQMTDMFNGCRVLATIYASSTFVVTQVTDSVRMFSTMSTNLVGGAGTVWDSSNPTDKTYAHIDGGTADPGYFTAKP